MASLSPFHLAIPVYNLEACRIFYRDVIGCQEGRSSTHWVDFNFFGHQLVIHFKQELNPIDTVNPVDGKLIPVPHFGVVLEWSQFNKFGTHLQSKNVNFIIEPYIRFEGEIGEQATLFFYDPSGNALEFKAFKDKTQLFAK